MGGEDRVCGLLIFGSPKPVGSMEPAVTQEMLRAPTTPAPSHWSHWTQLGTTTVAVRTKDRSQLGQAEELL